MSTQQFISFAEQVSTRVTTQLENIFSRMMDEIPLDDTDFAATLQSLQHLTLRGGKRFRATLLCAAYIGCKHSLDNIATIAAAAIELFQSYLLIQDDWMDNDATRRGGPSVHVELTSVFGTHRIGNSAAILASDLAWTSALQLLATLPGVSSARRIAALQAAFKMNRDVVIGQHLDILGHCRNVEQIHWFKTTSYTVYGPLILGATLGGASKKLLHSLSTYATFLGQAFQLRDDFLGVFGDSSMTGKPVGRDLIERKNTAILDEAALVLSPSQQEHLEKEISFLESHPENVHTIIQFLKDSGIHDAALHRLKQHCDNAMTAAQDLPLTKRANTILRGAAMRLMQIDH